MKAKDMESGTIFVSAYHASGLAGATRNGVTLRIIDAETRLIIIEADITFEAFGSTVVRHDEQPCLYHLFKRKE